MKKLSSLSVKKLFGTFDYQIDFEKKDGFTILTAPNGFGKSTILQIIHNASIGNFCFFAGMNFKEIVLKFKVSEKSENQDSASEKTLKITKKEVNIRKTDKNTNLGDSLGAAAIMDDDSESPKKGYECTVSCDGWQASFNSELIETSVLDMIEKIPDLERSYSSASSGNYRIFWTDIDGEVLDMAGVFERNVRRFIRTFPLVREWRAHVDFNALILSTKRLYVDPNSAPLIRRRPIRSSDGGPSRLERHVVRSLQVSEVSSDIRNDYFQCMRQHMDTSRKLDSEFVAKVLRILDNDKRPKDELEISVKKKMEDIQKLEKRCDKFGISTKSKNTRKLQASSTTTLAVLDLFLDDVQKKLAVFDSFLKKLELMTESLSMLLDLKKVEINMDDSDDDTHSLPHPEFMVTNTVTNTTIPLAALSSGEQHLIVLLNWLLFNNGLDADLVMIDEPELSFHPSWQEKFAGILDRIHNEYGKDFLLSTHSPAFIGDRWNNTIELAEMVEQK